MTSLMLLDQRKRLILNTLLHGRNYLTSGDLSAISGVTDRTVRNDLKIIMDELGSLKLHLEASPGLGYRIPEHAKDEIGKLLDSLGDVRPVSPDERMFFIIRQVLSGPVKLAGLLELINISESTLEKDLERCCSWFQRNKVKMLRCRNEIRLELSTEERQLIYIQYYSDISAISGIEAENLLKNDFGDYKRIKAELDRRITGMKEIPGDNEYTGLLISMLVGDGCVSFSRDNRKLKNKIRKSAAAALEKFDQIPSDDALIDSLTAAAAQADNSADRIFPGAGLQELEKQYPEALAMSVFFLDQMEEAIPGRDESLIVDTGMCFAAFLERSLLLNRKRVAVICTAGQGTVQLLEAKLKRGFPNLDIIGFFPKHRLSDAVQSNPDFLISTSELKTELDVVKISNFLNLKDVDRIMSYLRKNSVGGLIFRRLISEELFFTDIDLDTPAAVIHQLCSSAFGVGGDEFEKRVLEREALGATSVGNLAALPHAVRGDSAENSICIGILKKPIRWGGENVQLVLLLRLDDPDIDMAAVFEYIYSLVSNRRLLKTIITEQDFSLFSRLTEGDI